MDESDDEPLTLSSHALAALAEFNAEKDAHQQRYQKLQDEAEARAIGNKPLSMEIFSEDWNESQFWYSDETATLLAKELLCGATSSSTIVVVSAPSIFIALKNLTGANLNDTPPRLVLLEHDSRFAIFPEFIYYDYQYPLKLPASLKGCADAIICDPPFLSEDCQTKAALTVRWLGKPPGTANPPRLVICTGERMEQLVLKLYGSSGVKTTTFEPKHARSLSNEFYCYANFGSDMWQWRNASPPLKKESSV